MKRGSAPGAPSFKCLKSKLFLDLSSLTHAVTQIVQLSPADLTSTDGLDLLDHRAVEGEDLLHADAVRDAADGEGLVDTAVLLGNDGALEHLDTLTVAFLDAQVDTHGVAHVDCGGSLLRHVLLDKALHKIHSLFLLLLYRCS